MSAFSHTCASTPETAPQSSRIKGLFASLLHEFQVRRALRQMEALDDTALTDLGVSRGNLEDVVRCGRR